MEKKTVLIYQGGRRLVAQSGVGAAISHQEKALKEAGVEFEVSGFDSQVVHLNTVLPDSFLMAKRARKEGKKVVYHGHSTMEDFRNSFVGSNCLAPLFKRWIIHCYNQADVVLTPTPYSEELLKSYGLHPPVMAISNGVDTEFFRKTPDERVRFREKYGLSPEEKVVLSVGLPIERKGILDFIRMAESLPEYQFFWFGRVNPFFMKGNVKKAMKGAPSNCHFPGFVGKEELRDAYGGSDVFLFLSSEETEGIVLLEALSMELPILARKIGAYKGWLRDGENARLGEDFGEIRGTLKEMLEGGEPSLGEKGRVTAGERNLKSIGRRLATVYRTLYNGEGNS